MTGPESFDDEPSEPYVLNSSGYPSDAAPSPPAGADGYVYSDQRPSETNGVRKHFYIAAACAAGGAFFNGLSTRDFIQHLDRQVHSIHCSLLPGAAPTIGESGCRTVMMSPYSSILRESMWGGLPIALLGVATFCYLIARAFTFARRDQLTQHETRFAVAAFSLPVLMSLIYGTVSAVEIGALCTLCIGVYVSSLAGFIVVVIAHLKSPRSTNVSPMGDYGTWFLIGVVYVVGMALLYVVAVPQSEDPGAGCGTLARPDPPASAVFSLGGDGIAALAVIDPLCPSCRAFDKRLRASAVGGELALNGVLFPLDSQCNWMLDQPLHPGACMVSEAMLCAGKDATKVLDYAFANQERLTELARENKTRALKDDLVTAFPSGKGCIGSPAVRSKLNRSMRWAVKNALPVMTPQLFIGDQRVCDENTDLGLEYTLRQMTQGKKGGSK